MILEYRQTTTREDRSEDAIATWDSLSSFKYKHTTLIRDSGFL